jgi:hypothetical protein
VDFQVEYVRSADGTDIAVGRGRSGAPLLVVPYMAATIETTWAMCADAFPDYELVTYDRRGTGLSARGVDTRDPQPYFGSTSLPRSVRTAQRRCTQQASLAAPPMSP